MSDKALPRLISALQEAAPYPHPTARIRLIETHISWVLIAGDFAYKIKKPLDLGFLDFSSLDKRRHCCEEEVRLNRRLAPHIYLDAIAITGSETAPSLGGDGPAIEWAVRMRAFPADATLDHATQLTAEQADAIADTVARFHGEITRASEDSEFGSHETVMQPVRENFRQIRALLPSPGGGGALKGIKAGGEGDSRIEIPGWHSLTPTLYPEGHESRREREPCVNTIDTLEHWSESEGTRLAAYFAQRKKGGFIRECHGDLHLGNIAWVDAAPLIFDCIEFNPALRWIDVQSELAFLCMDLMHRGRQGLAWRLLNRYLEHTGDYAGLQVFRFYLVYRAMVRAKVAGIRAGQGETTAAAEMASYLHLADGLSQPGQARLMLMHGVSGSGKTWLSRQILERLGAVRLRSDVERKRLFGLDALDDSRRIEGGIYTAAASAQTFQNLLDLARTLLAAGYPVIVDATFLKQAHREPFVRLAETLGVPLHILALQADAALLRQRVRQRSARADDASEADLSVLDMQLQAIDPFTQEEAKHLSVFDSAQAEHWPQRIEQFASQVSPSR